MLVHHGRRDGQRIVSRDGRSERRHHQFCRRTGGDRNGLRAAHQTETSGDGVRSDGARRIQPVQTDGANVNGPLYRWALDHGLVVVGNGVEVHRGISVGGHRAAWCDVDRGDVGRVEQDLGPEGLGHGVARIERSVCVAGIGGSDDDPCLLT